GRGLHCPFGGSAVALCPSASSARVVFPCPGSCVCRCTSSLASVEWRTGGRNVLGVPCGGGGDGERSPSPCRSRVQEFEEVVVELLLVGGGQTVRGTGVNLQRRSLDDLRGALGRRDDRHDLVVVSVDDQGRHVDALEVLGEV